MINNNPNLTLLFRSCNCDGGCRHCPDRYTRDCTAQTCRYQEPLSIIPEVPAPAPIAAPTSCIELVSSAYAGDLSTKEAVQAIFKCYDANNDGKITVEETCAIVNCDMPGSNITTAQVKDELKKMGDPSTEYITPAEFDSILKDDSDHPAAQPSVASNSTSNSTSSPLSPPAQSSGVCGVFGGTVLVVVVMGGLVAVL